MQAGTRKQMVNGCMMCMMHGDPQQWLFSRIFCSPDPTMPSAAMMDRAASWVARFGDLSPRMWASASGSLMVSPTASTAPSFENREKSMAIQKKRSSGTAGTASTTTSTLLKTPKHLGHKKSAKSVLFTTLNAFSVCLTLPRASRSVLSHKDLKQDPGLHESYGATSEFASNFLVMAGRG